MALVAPGCSLRRWASQTPCPLTILLFFVRDLKYAGHVLAVHHRDAYPLTAVIPKHPERVWFRRVQLVALNGHVQLIAGRDHDHVALDPWPHIDGHRRSSD